MTEPTDEQLLASYADGQDSAFEMLVVRHGADVKSYALRLLQRHELAEDVYQKTFLQVIRHKGRWDPRGSVRGFLFTVAHRCCIDIMRHRKKTRLAAPELTQIAETQWVSPSPDAVALLGERAAQLEDAIGKLAPRHREVLLLRAVHGLSVEDTAAALCISPKTVYDRLSYARKRLVTTLADVDANPSPRKKA